MALLAPKLCEIRPGTTEQLARRIHPSQLDMVEFLSCLSRSSPYQVQFGVVFHRDMVYVVPLAPEYISEPPSVTPRLLENGVRERQDTIYSLPRFQQRLTATQWQLHY